MKQTTLHLIAKIVLGVLIVIFFLLCVMLVREYDRLQKFEAINSYKELITDLKKHHPLTEQDVSIIQPWMTFSYINQIFALPSTYLSGALNITDSRYPRITVSKYVKSNHLDQNVFVQSLKNEVGQYFKNKE